MAGIGNKVASIRIVLNGIEENINGLDNMKARAKELNKELKDLQKLQATAASTENWKAYNDAGARIQEVNTALSQLRGGIREENKALKDMNTLMQDLDKKTLKDLQRDLKLAQQKFRVIDPKDLNNLAKGKEVISQIQAAIAKRQSGGDLARTMADLKRELGDLKTAPIERLRDAQKRLTDAINTSKRGTAEYKAAMEQLKGINKHIDSATESFKNQDSMITKTMKRLASYVAVYMGFNQLIGKAKEIISGNIALSDSIADIQKVTKMTTEQVDALALSIDKIDTRSSQESLMSLGYSAGMLGLKSTQDILGFVKAADQMNWALKELGEDGAVQLMKVAQLTHEVTEENGGVQGALNKVGSAINEITASSASSAAPIVDYVSRLGSVGSVAGYTSSQLVAIGSTLDSLAVPAERGSTAMSKFISALQTNRVSIAESLGMSYKDLDQIEKTRGSMAMMVEVLERLKQKGSESENAMAILKPMFKEFGGEGERLVGVMTTMIENVDTFKEHIGITSQAFEEGTSMLNEFNVKNETAAATFARVGNTIREAFVNSSMVRKLQSFGQWLVDLYRNADRHVVAWGALKAVMFAVYGVMIAMLKTGMVKFYAAIVEQLAALKASYQAQVAAILAKNAATNQETAATVANTAATAAETGATVAATGATVSWTVALKALWATLMSNPLTVVLGLLGAVTGAVVALTDAIFAETDAEIAEREAKEEATKATIESNTVLTKEQNELKKVSDKLEEVKNNEEGRRRLIAEINQKYGPYLKNLLTEKDDYDKIKSAIAGVNEQLKINAALKLKDKLDELANNSLGKKLESIGLSADDDIDWLVHGWEKKLKDGKTMEGLRAAIQKAVGDAAQKGLKANGDAAVGYKEFKETMMGIIKSFTNVTVLAPMSEGEQLEDLYDRVQETAEAWSAYNAKLKENADNAARTIGNGKDLETTLREQEKLAEEVAKRKEEDLKKAESESKRMKDIVNQENSTLKQWYDNLEELGKYNSQNANFRKLFEDYFGADALGSVLDASGKVVQKKAQAMISKTMESIKLELKDRGLTPELSHKSPGKESHKDPAAQLKKDVQNAFNYLKAYYNEEEAKWLREREQHPDLITQEVTDDRIRKTKESYEAAFQQLSQFLLKKNNDFMQNTPVLDYFGTNNVDVKDLRDRVQKDGEQIWDDITKNMTEAQRKQLESMVKHLNDMQKIIEKYDFVAQAEHSLQEGLVKNQLYYAEYYADMKQLAEEGNNLTVASLRERYHIEEAEAQALLVLLSDYHDQYLEAIKKQNERVTKLTKLGYKEQQTEWQEHIKQMDSWAKQMKEHESAMGTDNKYSLELEMNTLRLKEAAQQEYIDILRQQLTEEWALRLGFSEKILAEEQAIQERERELREQNPFVRNIEGLIENDPEILASRARLQAMRDEIDARIALSTEYQNAQQTLTSIQEEQAQKQIEIEDRMKEAWKQYHDIIADGAEDVGEKIGDLFTSDDRQKAVENLREAGKDILKELTKQTMQMVQQWIMRKIQKAAIRKAELLADKAADAAEIASDQAKNLAISTGNAASVLSKMTVKASETTATAEAGIAEGTANAMSIGPWGSALVPIVISLITGALITGISAIGKAKQEVTAETGVSEAQASSFAKKKVAAGMFTYAEGRYPVLANDGNTYNARYENRLRTGLYDRPHFAVFGEKGREMVIDGQTTDRMLTFRPDLYKDIISLRDGDIRQRARAYADGRYLSTTNGGVTTPSPSTTTVPSGSAAGPVLSELTATLSALHRTLESGIYARLVEDFSEDGPINRMEQDRKWMQDHGLLK